jgi:predicted ATPase/DNA-binding SARP family transcriptional activator
MPPVVISLFGPLAVSVNGVAVTKFRSNKVRALLAYLLLAQPQPLVRGAVGERLWAGYGGQSAQTNLRQALTNLRNCLAPFDLLDSNRTHLSVKRDPATLWCDVHQFEALLDACQQHEHRTLADCTVCRPRLQAAVALAQAPLLENFPATDSNPFNAWLQSQRERLAARLATAQAALAAGATVRGNLPPPLTSLVGRDHELAALVEKLQDDVYRCVSLIGPGGIGKTRLAVAVGARLQEAFPDGVWVVELSGLAPSTPDEPTEQLHDRLAAAMASAIGLTFYGTTHPTEQVAKHLADKGALLILDSFEHLVAGAAWLPTLLTAAPRLRLLVTTRHRLPLRSQLVYHVEGLGVPPAAAVNGRPAHLVAQYTGVQLFVERAESAGLTLALDGETLAAVGRLCHLVEGSPWAIEVAAAMLDHHTPAALLAAIQGNYRTLTTNLLDVPARQRSAEALFLTVWSLLTVEEAQTLACCAVFRGGFTLDAAQRVAATTPTTLEALVQKSLLIPSGDRYTMHDLVRQFAEEQLGQDAASAQQSHTAHASYFTALLATWQPNDATEQRFRTAVTLDWENVQTAWTWALDHAQIALLQQAVAGLAEYYEMSGLFLESDRTFETAIARTRLLLATRAATAQDAPTQTTALPTLLAHLLWRHLYLLTGALGQSGRTQGLAEELLAWGRQLADDRLIARGYYELSIVALHQGDYRHQEALLRQALPLAQQWGDRREQAIYLLLLGISLKMQHDYATAQRYFEEALTLAQKLGASRLAILILNNLGGYYWDTGNFTQAIACFQQTLQRAQQMGQNDSATFATANLGALAYTLGDYDNAYTASTAAHQGYIELGDKVLEAQLLTLLAALFAEQGETTRAADYCRHALATAVAQVYPVQQPALLTQGHLQRDAGNWAAARTAYEAAYTLSRQTNLLTEWLPVQVHLAALHLAQGETAAALTAVEPLLAHFADSQWSAAQRPQELLLIAYQILVANADPRAPAIRDQAWALVQEQLAKIDDPRLRQTFLTNVPVNRVLGRLVASG